MSRRCQCHEVCTRTSSVSSCSAKLSCRHVAVAQLSQQQLELTEENCSTLLLLLLQNLDTPSSTQSSSLRPLSPQSSQSFPGARTCPTCQMGNSNRSPSQTGTRRTGVANGSRVHSPRRNKAVQSFSSVSSLTDDTPRALCTTKISSVAMRRKSSSPSCRRRRSPLWRAAATEKVSVSLGLPHQSM